VSYGGGYGYRRPVYRKVYRPVYRPSYGYSKGYYGRKKRSADPEPAPEALADPHRVSYGGYGGFGGGFSRPLHPNVLNPFHGSYGGGFARPYVNVRPTYGRPHYG